jgi:hypothetical protein
MDRDGCWSAASRRRKLCVEGDTPSPPRETRAEGWEGSRDERASPERGRGSMPPGSDTAGHGGHKKGEGGGGAMGGVKLRPVSRVSSTTRTYTGCKSIPLRYIDKYSYGQPRRYIDLSF